MVDSQLIDLVVSQQVSSAIAYTRNETQRGTIGPDEGLQIRIGLRSLGVFGGS